LVKVIVFLGMGHHVIEWAVDWFTQQMELQFFELLGSTAYPMTPCHIPENVNWWILRKICRIGMWFVSQLLRIITLCNCQKFPDSLKCPVDLFLIHLLLFFFL
jgi:hypothetical protein